MTIKWSFLCNSNVKFPFKKIGSHRPYSIQICVIIRSFIKGRHCRSHKKGLTPTNTGNDTGYFWWWRLSSLHGSAIWSRFLLVGMSKNKGWVFLFGNVHIKTHIWIFHCMSRTWIKLYCWAFHTLLYTHQTNTISAQNISRDIDKQIVIIFLPILWSICFRCPKEMSHWDSSFEYLRHMFWWRNKFFFSNYTLI